MEDVFQRFCDSSTNEITKESLQQALSAMTPEASAKSMVPCSNAGVAVTEDDLNYVFEELADGEDVVDFLAFCNMWPGALELSRARGISTMPARTRTSAGTISM